MINNKLNNLYGNYFYEDLHVEGNLAITHSIQADDLNVNAMGANTIGVNVVNNIRVPHSITLDEDQTFLLNGVPLEAQIENKYLYTKFVLTLLGLGINVPYLNSLFDPRSLYPLSQSPDNLLAFFNIKQPFQRGSMIELSQSILDRSIVINSHVGINPNYYSSIIAGILANLPIEFSNIISLLLPSSLDTRVQVCASVIETENIVVNDLSSLITAPVYYSVPSTRSVILARDSLNKVIPNKHVLAPLSLVFTDAAGYLKTPIEIPHLPFIDLDPALKIQTRLVNLVNTFSSYYTKDEINIMIAAFATISAYAPLMAALTAIQVECNAILAAVTIDKAGTTADLAGTTADFAGTTADLAGTTANVATCQGTVVEMEALITSGTAEIEGAVTAGGASLTATTTAGETAIAASTTAGETAIATSLATAEASMGVASAAAITAIVAAGVFHLTGPRGPTGATGPQGPTGLGFIDLGGSFDISQTIGTSQRIATTYVPSNIYDLTNKLYVDTVVDLKANQTTTYTKIENDNIIANYTLTSGLTSYVNGVVKWDDYSTTTQANGLYKSIGYSPDLSSYSTTTQANGLYKAIGYSPDLSSYSTTAQANALYKEIGYSPDLSSYSTTAQANGLYKEIGYSPDLSSYSTTVQTNTLIQSYNYITNNINNEIFVNNGLPNTTQGSLRLVSTGIGNFIQSGLQHYDTANSSTSADLIFCNMSWGTEWMRIKADGKIGISTNAPDEKLHVNGNIKADSNMICSSVPTSDSHLTNKLYIANNYLPLSGGTLTGTLNTGSEVYVNNSVDACIRLLANTGGNYIQSGLNNGTSIKNLYITSINDGVEWIRCDGTDGNVGIGNIDPTERLHVNGNFLASGNINGVSPTNMCYLTTLTSDVQTQLNTLFVNVEDVDMTYLNSLTSNVQAQLTSLQNRITALENLFFISSITSYYNDQYNVLHNNLGYGYFEYNLINMTTGKATVAVFNKVEGSPIQWFNIITDPDLNVYYRIGQIEVVNNAAYNILINFSVRKLL